MDQGNDQHTEWTARQAEAYHEELAWRIGLAVPTDGSVQALEGLHLGRASIPRVPVHTVLEPSFCVIAQGSKEVFLGDLRYRYDPSHYLITTIDLPFAGQVLEASKERPYLSLRLKLSPAVVSSVAAESGHVASPGRGDVRAMDVSPLDLGLQDCVVRLVRLLDSPTQAPVLMPLITREIIYRLLMGQQSARFRHLVTLAGYSPRIARAVEKLRRDFDQPLRIEHLAHELGMSISGFQHHFKAVTGTSPLQFQKQLRLHEARRLMLNEDHDAASAGHRAGYQDAAHFNRQYKQLFGVPPMRDVQRLRQVANSLMAAGPVEQRSSVP